MTNIHCFLTRNHLPCTNAFLLILPHWEIRWNNGVVVCEVCFRIPSPASVPIIITTIVTAVRLFHWHICPLPITIDWVYFLAIPYFCSIKSNSDEIHINWGKFNIYTSFKEQNYSSRSKVMEETHFWDDPVYRVFQFWWLGGSGRIELIDTSKTFLSRYVIR